MNSTADQSKGEPLPRVRRVSHLNRVGIVLIVVLALIGEGRMGWAAAAETEGPPRPPPQWRVSATVNYSSGSYGADSRTNILYAPMTVRRIFRDGDISLTIPFVSTSGTGAVRLVGGAPTKIDSSGGSGVGTSGGGPGRGKNPGESPLADTTTDSGLGDIILRGRY